MACQIRIVLNVGFVVGLASAWKALFTCGVLLHTERHVLSGEETLYESRLNYIQSVTMSEELAWRRTACKGWMIRASQNLEKVLSDTATLTITKLVSAMEEFDKRWASLDEVQVLLNDINTAADFRDSVMKSRVLATEKFDELAAPVPYLNADNRTNVSNNPVDVKLPKLNLPKFSGDVLQWASFWDQFSVTVHDKDSPVVSEFTYLMSLLEGEPKQAIHGLSLTADHYAIACKILKDRFGRKETIIITHIQKLLHLSVPSKCTVSALWKLNDELQAHTRSLEALGIDGKQYWVILTPMILSRMPHDIRMEWSRDGAGHESDLNFLLKFREKEIQVVRDRKFSVILCPFPVRLLMRSVHRKSSLLLHYRRRRSQGKLSRIVVFVTKSISPKNVSN